MTHWIIAAVVVIAAWRFVLGYPRLARGYQYVGRGEAAFLSAAAEATFPSGGAIEYSGLDADVPAYTDRFLAAAHPRMRLLMKLLFFLVQHATVFFPAPGPRGWRRFSSLGVDQRVAVLEGWRTSRLFPRRLVFTSLRAIVTMGYMAYPPVMRALGLAPYDIVSPVCEADLLYPPIGMSRRSVLYVADDRTPPSSGVPIALDAPRHPAYVEVSP